MFSLASFGSSVPLENVLCLGAHCDDIEIGCGGTLLRMVANHAVRSVTWVVFTSDTRRESEAVGSARTLLSGVPTVNIVVKDFRDGFLPFHGLVVKEYFEELKRALSPALVFTHYRDDRHQDHRLISDLTWNTFRDHAILEYEIPKYDGDMASPNVFVELSEACSRQKVAHVLRWFGSQAEKRWFTEDVFLSLLRLRGMECNSASGYAEGFYGRKVVIRAGERGIA